MKKAVLWIGCLMLSGCMTVIPNPFAVEDFSNAEPIALNVSDIDISSDVLTFHRLPHIENKMPVPPSDALTNWAKNRFVAADESSDITVDFTVRQAYMLQTDKPSDKWYMLDNVSYRLEYTADFVFKRNNMVVNAQSVTGWEQQSLPKKSSLSAKEDAWEIMLNNMVKKVNNQITSQIPADLMK